MRDADENLKTIWFDGEMLPNWAQLLDAAARLCPVSEGTRRWFSRLTNSSGVDDTRTIVAEAKILQDALRETREAIINQLLGREETDKPPGSLPPGSILWTQ
jgi:hypothetical protein